jgi:hypothetical protein
MSEIDLIKTAAFAVTDKSLITVDFAAIDKVQKETREARAKANPLKPEPEQVRKNRLKREHFSLKQEAHNAAVRLNEYGVPGVRLAQDKIDAALKARKIAADLGSLMEERRQEKLLQAAEEELLAAQARLEKFRNGNTRAVGLLKSWEAENLPSKSVE